MQYAFAAVISFVLVWALIPPIKTWALRIQFVDQPNHRKLHKNPIPLMGGVAIVIGFFITAFFFAKGSRELDGILLGGAVIFFLGLFDDYGKTRSKELPAWPKLLVQIGASAILPAFGVSVQGMNIPFLHPSYVLFPTWLGIASTMIWVIGITNMMNFLDGVDGLAAGISAISATTLFFIAIVKGHPSMAMLAIILVGVSLGFLRHNFYPARIFMGDAGATFLGFILAGIAVEGAFKSAALVSVAIPVLALGVPIMDAFYVIFRRFRENRPIYVADKGHTFHQLMRSGLSQKQTVTILYLLGICFSLLSIVLLLS